MDQLEKILEENRRLKDAVEELAALNEISTAIGSSMAVEEINNRIVAKVIKRVHATQGAIFLPGRASETSMNTMVRVKDSSVEENPVHMTIALTGWMIKNQRALNISRNHDPDGLLRHAQSEVHSALSVPLRAHGKFIGALTCFNKQDAEKFTADDQRFLTIVAGQSAQVIESARLLLEEQQLFKIREEMRITGRYQALMMPEKFPELPEYQIYGRNLPASEVGGDCFDAVQLDDTRILLSLGDVSGKGLSAALLMANAQAIIRSQFSGANARGSDLGLLVQAVSEYLSQWSEHEKYITLFLGELDTATHQFTYVNAGHNPPYLRRASGDIETLEVGGVPMGMFAGMDYECGSVTLDPGSRLVIFTDGVTELFNEQDEEFGEERLERFIHSNCDCTSEEFTDRLYSHLHDFRGQRDPSDDITLLTVRRG